jgi:hypothetical protein
LVVEKALIHSFRQENGFGYVELEDGRELRFDVSVCLAPPEVGQRVRIVVSDSRIEKVEPLDAPDSSHPVTTLPEAVRRLRAEGLVSELTQSELDEIVRELSLSGLPEDVPVVLAAYYAHPELGRGRALEDRYLRFGQRDLARAIAGLLDETVDENLDEVAAPPSLRGGELPLSDQRFVDSVRARPFASPQELAIVDGENAALMSQGDARRIVSLAGGDGALCMAISRARRLAECGALPLELARPHLRAPQHAPWSLS